MKVVAQNPLFIKLILAVMLTQCCMTYSLDTCGNFFGDSCSAIDCGEINTCSYYSDNCCNDICLLCEFFRTTRTQNFTDPEYALFFNHFSFYVSVFSSNSIPFLFYAKHIIRGPPFKTS